MPTTRPSKQWWTVFAVYDDNQEPYIEFVEAKDKAEARAKALRAADGIILIAGIAPGKIPDADVNDLDNVVPIRGKGHAIDVSLVRVTTRKVTLPGRCPECRADLRRSGAMIETFLSGHKWPAHLSWNGKDLSPERDGKKTNVAFDVDCAVIACAKCNHKVWNGLASD